MKWSSICSMGNTPHQQDGPWSWMVLACATLQTCLAVGVIRCFGVFLPVLMTDLNQSRQGTALVSSLHNGIGLLLSAPTSWLCTRYGCRLVSSIGHVVCIVSLVMSSLMHDVIPLYLSYSLVAAIGHSLVLTPPVLCAVKYFNKRRSLALGILASGGGMGVMTLPLLAQFLISAVGWRNAYRVMASLYCISAFLSYVYDPNVERAHGAGGDSAGGGRAEKEALSLKKMFDLSVWKVPRYAAAATSLAIATFGLYNAPVHLVKYSEEIGVSADQASTLYIFMGLTSILSRIAAGRLCDISRALPSYLNQGAQLIGGLCVILLTLATSYSHLVAFALFNGVAEGAFRTTLNVLLISSVCQAKSSAAFGMGGSLMSVFSASGPAIAGMMADRSGTYYSAFYMSGGVVLFAALIHFVPLCLPTRAPQGAVECPMPSAPVGPEAPVPSGPAGPEASALNNNYKQKWDEGEEGVVESYENPVVVVNTEEEMTAL